VERWFGKLTDKRIRRGSFSSVEELERAIEEYMEENNKQPKPFVWAATVEQILAKGLRPSPTSMWLRLQYGKGGAIVPQRKGHRNRDDGSQRKVLCY
jgi:hypothetical protein